MHMEYAQEVLSRFGTKNCISVKNPIVSGIKLSRNDRRTKVDATLFNN